MKTSIVILTAILTTATLPAANILFDLQGQAGFGLLSGNETGAVAGTPGTGGEIGGGITYDTDSNLLTLNIGWGTGNSFADLTGNATGAHIHGPTLSGGIGAFAENAGVKINLNGNGYTLNTSASGGSVTGVNSVALSAQDETDLLAGKWYINIHTAANGGGEIRGNLVQAVPEPSTLALGALALVGAGVALRRRQR